MINQQHISNWLYGYCTGHNMSGYVVGVSGGIDSAVTSTLCAMTGLKTIVILMPIHQAIDQHKRGENHIDWLAKKFDNVEFLSVPLTSVFDELLWNLPRQVNENKLALANSKARLRMTALYAVAKANGCLVTGTGNKVEDFGLGFFTKYGDGGVDVSPIGELTKTEVWQLGRELGINQEIIDAVPTDGLHEDNRSDEMQIGATYPEIEWAMDFDEETLWHTITINDKRYQDLSDRQKEVLEIYRNFHYKNAHKMVMPPICPKNG